MTLADLAVRIYRLPTADLVAAMRWAGLPIGESDWYSCRAELTEGGVVALTDERAPQPNFMFKGIPITIAAEPAT